MKLIQYTLFLCFLLQGCTIVYHVPRTTRVDEVAIKRNTCEFTYSIELNVPYSASLSQKRHNKYKEMTQKVLDDTGCIHQESNKPGVNGQHLEVTILTRGFETLPQTWLTGLSFGIIPSWSTTPGAYMYRFTVTSQGNEFIGTYSVDVKTINHILVFPVIWINAFTFRQPDTMYEESLRDFFKVEIPEVMDKNN